MSEGLLKKQCMHCATEITLPPTGIKEGAYVLCSKGCGALHILNSAEELTKMDFDNWMTLQQKNPKLFARIDAAQQRIKLEKGVTYP